MTDIQWFAFVILPLGVSILGTLLAGIVYALIQRADRKKTAAD